MQVYDFHLLTVFEACGIGQGKGMRAVKLLKRNPPVLNWGCWVYAFVTLHVVYNGHKMFVCTVVAVAVM